MKILFYDTKKYDKDSFEKARVSFPDIEIDYLEPDLSPQTASLAEGYDGVCAFVSSDVGAEVIDKLADKGVKLVLMRCAEAVAEHAMMLALAVNRHVHKSYIRVRENNFSLAGLTGVNFHGKTAGIVGTGKIGAAMCRMCQGFGMKVIAYDMYPNKSLDFVEYVDLETLLKTSDLISLHCPLTDETYHMISEYTISRMKDNVILVNTSRGALINTADLIAGIRAKKFFGVGLDVYEEETNNVFENREDDILETSITFPNVIVTSHQGFFTEEALLAISQTSLQNAMDYQAGSIDQANLVC